MISTRISPPHFYPRDCGTDSSAKESTLTKGTSPEMASEARSGSLTRAAIYAQGRRDKEAETREQLAKRLPAEAFRPDINSRGDFNITTKTLLATLLFLDPYATIPDVPNIHSSSAEYNQQRRTNETTIRDCLESTLPKRLFTPNVTDRGDLNNTTKVMVAAGCRVEEVLRERISGETSTSTLSEAQDVSQALLS